MTWHDAASGRSETVTVERLIWQADSASDDLALSGAGEFEEHPFILAGELGSIATLRRGEGPYPIALELTLEDLKVALRGSSAPSGKHSSRCGWPESRSPASPICSNASYPSSARSSSKAG